MTRVQPPKSDTSRTEKVLTDARESFDESAENALRVFRAASEATTDLALGELSATVHFLSDVGKTLTRRRARTEGASAVADGVRQLASLSSDLTRNVSESIIRRADSVQKAADRFTSDLDAAAEEKPAT